MQTSNEGNSKAVAQIGQGKDDTIAKLTTPEQLLDFATKIVESKLSPLKNPADVVNAILIGRELGIPGMASIQNIYPINGRATLGVHLTLGILLRNDIVYEIIRDGEPVFEYITFYNEHGEPDVNGKPDLTTLQEDFERPKETGEKKKSTPVDYRSIVKFERMHKRPDGTYRTIISYGKYSWREAEKAGLTAKDNWKNYATQMITNRAITFGARRCAPDLLMGLYESSEIADVNDVDYNVDSGDGDVTIIPKEQPKKTTEAKEDDSDVVEAEEVIDDNSEESIEEPSQEETKKETEEVAEPDKGKEEPAKSKTSASTSKPKKKPTRTKAKEETK